MLRTWTLNHTCHFVHMNVVMIITAFVTTNIVQDCSFRMSVLTLHAYFTAHYYTAGLFHTCLSIYVMSILEVE